ncbi:hypothetical protein, partial [Lapillicoccus sp.]|uniref:hypothetical protein n=1 Tax=Lapillicoccus sp. TaxID=1909287 RepID=UPI0025F5DAC2
ASTAACAAASAVMLGRLVVDFVGRLVLLVALGLVMVGVPFGGRSQHRDRRRPVRAIDPIVVLIAGRRGKGQGWPELIAQRREPPSMLPGGEGSSRTPSGRRGHKEDPLYKIHGLLRRGRERLSEKQEAKLNPCLIPVCQGELRPAGHSKSV